MKMEILLKSIDDVKEFVNEVSKVPYDVDLSSGRYVVDAKSIMGIFSLDLSNKIMVEGHCTEAADAEAFEKTFEKFRA